MVLFGKFIFDKTLFWLSHFFLPTDFLTINFSYKLVKKIVLRTSESFSGRMALQWVKGKSGQFSQTLTFNNT